MNIIRKITIRIRKSIDMRQRKLKITKNFKDLKERKRLTHMQKKEVQDFYKSMIGRKVPLHCHEYFYSRTGVFTKEYVPANFYHCELIPRANLSMARIFGDKNMCDILFHNENVAHSILKNMNGYYYFEGKPVSEEEAISFCQNLKQVVIKPSRESKGHGVQLFNVNDGVTDIDGLTIGDLFKRYKKDFLIQECVKQHKDMAALNPTSLNTIRVLSYRSGMEVLIVYAVVRIGRKGQVIDNQCAGGISTTVSKDGKLGKTAFGGFAEDNILQTDSGVVLDGYQIPSFEKVISLVKNSHLQLPYLDIVGWDVAIQENGDPVIIEFNINPGLSQSAFRSGMGEYTERIIRELWPKPNTLYPSR